MNENMFYLPNRKNGKKEEERSYLLQFIKEYEYITGDVLEIIESRESPDFTCRRANGELIGIELTQITRGNPSLINTIEVVYKQKHMSVEDAIIKLQRKAIYKEEKRREDTWLFPDKTILMFQLTDIPLHEIEKLLYPQFVPDLYNTGFCEIWITDYTGLSTYGEIETFCIIPKKWYGYHKRDIEKPYG